MMRWLSPGAILLVAACGGEAAPGGGGGVACQGARVRSVPACKRVVGRCFAPEGAAHVPDGTRIVYEHNPPHSGDHFSDWETRRGEHKTAIPRGRWVHNLEHGHIVLLYNCKQACPAGLAVLRKALAARPKASILLTPDPLLDPPRFAAVAWRWVYETDTPHLATLLCFIDQHLAMAPEDVPL